MRKRREDGIRYGGRFTGKRAREKDAKRRLKEQARWNSLAGPVTITFVDPASLEGGSSRLALPSSSSPGK